MGLYGTPMPDIILLQACVYIAVDMLPVPGAQGITEAMYRTVFETVFPADCLVASMCITRGISFYLVMAVSFTVWGIRHVIYIQCNMFNFHVLFPPYQSRILHQTFFF